MSDKIRPPFNSGDLEMICKILADTNFGLTGPEIEHIFAQLKLTDPNPKLTKWKRLYNTFVEYQNSSQKGNKILSFIAKALQPTKYINKKDLLYDKLHQINQVLAFHGLQFKDDGRFHKVHKANNLSEAALRAGKLRSIIQGRNLHPDLLTFCKKELLTQNYFHAVLEATKTIASKTRDKSNLTLDGAKLFEAAFLGKEPILIINNYRSESEISEQKGFAKLLIGIFGMFRNPTAHAPKIEWDLKEEDAMDLFSTVSLALRRIDDSSVVKK